MKFDKPYNNWYYVVMKKYRYVGIAILLIGIVFVGPTALSTSQKNKENSFKTISYDEEATASGQIAGAFDVATPSATIAVYYQPYPSKTPMPIKTTPTNTNPTSTPAPATNNTVQNTATPAPTTQPQPTQPPAPTATSKPRFGGSINTNIEGDNLQVTIDANMSLIFCKIHFLKDVSGADVPVGDKNPTPDGNKCFADNSKFEVKKIKAYITSSESATITIEKSGPFE